MSSPARGKQMGVKMHLDLLHTIQKYGDFSEDISNHITTIDPNVINPLRIFLSHTRVR